MNGIDLTIEEFEKLSAKERDKVLYLNLREVRTQSANFILHRKIQYGAITILFAIVGILANALF